MTKLEEAYETIGGPDWFRMSFYIMDMAVEKDMQGRGIGTALIEQVKRLVSDISFSTTLRIRTFSRRQERQKPM